MTPKRGEVWRVRLDPTEGSEIKKTRPCLVMTSNTLNRLRQTVVVVPFSTSSTKANPPITIPIQCQGRAGFAVIDQVRAVAKHRLYERLETTSAQTLQSITDALAEILEIV